MVFATKEIVRVIRVGQVLGVTKRLAPMVAPVMVFVVWNQHLNVSVIVVGQPPIVLNKRVSITAPGLDNVAKVIAIVHLVVSVVIVP